MAGLPAVFGAACIDPNRAFTSSDQLPELFSILKDGGCKHMDTAALYGQSEELLGKAKVGEHFTVDTKTKGGFIAGYATRENVIKDAENSKKMLGCEVDVFYIHAPDMEHTPLENTLEGVSEVYKSGFFKRFGLSNFKAEDVQKVYDICKEKDYPLPTVYQGNYSPIARLQETLLFPTLRKLNMSFYAYSPLAGGFLTKSRSDIAEGKGRFDQSKALGKMYSGMYGKPSYLDALEKWEKVAADEGVGRAELAYRWVAWNSPLKREKGDMVIYSASGYKQAKETLEFITKGPLSEKAVKAIDDVWKTIEHEAPLDNYHR